MSAPGLTCASCAHIGVSYWGDTDSRIHHCGKSAERRREEMKCSGNFADNFMANFRAFFDASARQRACRHYEERPLAPPAVIGLLSAMKAGGGGGEFAFFSDENRLAERMNGKYVEYDQYAEKSSLGNRVYRLTDVGRAEIERSTTPQTSALADSAKGST